MTMNRKRTFASGSVVALLLVVSAEQASGYITKPTTTITRHGKQQRNGPFGFALRSSYHASDHSLQPMNSTSSSGYPRQSSLFLEDGEDALATLHKAMAASEVSSMEICSYQDVQNKDRVEAQSSNNAFPYAGILQASAGYISDHLDRYAVFYIPSEVLMPGKDGAVATNLIADIALSWTLGLKLVLVVGCQADTCSLSDMECRNSVRVCGAQTMHDMEQEAGYIRYEVERVLNRHLRMHGGMSPANPHAPLLNGNVVGGNFYLAKTYGNVDGVDYESAGYVDRVHTERIEQALKNNDVVLLTTVGSSRLGDLVSVNGNHLAASVATSLQARKLVYFSSNGGVLRKRGEKQSLQDVSLDTAKALLHYSKIQIRPNKGVAGFEEHHDEQSLELLLHLAWSSWALEQGVYRAHIVNPYDGALLEEFFTAKNGVNTCLYGAEGSDDLDLDPPEDDAAPFFE